MHTPKNHPYLSSFGRNRGRSLRPHQQGLVDALLPTLEVQITPESGLVIPGLSRTRSEAERGEANLLQSTAAGDPGICRDDAFPSLALEIGFGGGEHLLAQAAHHPEITYIGCEPFLNGVAKCLVGIEAQKLTNIRLYTGDARELIEALPDHALDTVFILFPDPWPKLRHNKRRLVNAQTLSMLARVHKKGGRLLIATDHEDYSVWILEVLQAHPDYRWTAEKAADWLTPPSDWTETKYQRKTSAEGRAPQFFECVRN